MGNKGQRHSFFDFNCDGRTSMPEILIAKTFFDKINDDKYRWRERYQYNQQHGIYCSNFETEQDYLLALSRAKISFRNSWRVDPDYGVDCQDFETEDAYLKAIEKKKYGWRDNHTIDSAYGIHCRDYETEEAYLKAIENAKSRWRLGCQAGLKFGVDCRDYETEKDYLNVLEEAKYGWRSAYHYEYGIDYNQYETEEEYLEALEAEKYSWRSSCQEGLEFGVDCHNYETMADYLNALDQAKYGWRDTCESGFKYDIDSWNYETEEAYLEALAQAKREEEKHAIHPEDYPNLRQYHAAKTLTKSYIYAETKEICEFILEKSSTIHAANYLTSNGEFLYAQAIKENFDIPIILPHEDEKQEISFPDMMSKLARKDIPFTIHVWQWFLTHFLPYANYDRYAADNFTDFLFSKVDAEAFQYAVLDYMDAHPDFRISVVQKAPARPYNINDYIYSAMQHGLLDTAKALFEDCLIADHDDWKLTNDRISGLLERCENYTEVESIQFAEKELLPLVEALEDEMILQEIEFWKKEISEYKEDFKTSGAIRSVSTSGIWQKFIPDEKEYDPKPADSAPLQKKQATPPQSIPQDDRIDDETIYYYCGVLLGNTQKVYHFIFGEEDVQIGDRVLVSIGAHALEVVGKVVSTGQYKRIATPFPIEKTKPILRKLS